jgi:hypothetical protein
MASEDLGPMRPLGGEARYFPGAVESTVNVRGKVKGLYRVKCCDAPAALK